MFKARPSKQAGDSLFEDRFCQVESAVAFKKITCYQCDFEAIYKYQVMQIRRHREIEVGEEEEIRPDHVKIWNSMPRFAEIPQTLKCKRCGEVLGIYTSCVY